MSTLTLNGVPSLADKTGAIGTECQHNQCASCAYWPESAAAIAALLDALTRDA